MTLELTLSPELEARLRREAARRGELVDDLAIHLLEQTLPEFERIHAVDVLGQWTKETVELSEEEAAENAQILKQLDADRPSFRPLFSGASQGVS